MIATKQPQRLHHTALAAFNRQAYNTRGPAPARLHPAGSIFPGYKAEEGPG